MEILDKRKKFKEHKEKYNEQTLHSGEGSSSYFSHECGKPRKSFTKKENQIGSAVNEVLLYRQTGIPLLLYKDR